MRMGGLVLLGMVRMVGVARLLLAAACLVVLAACGGSGGSGDETGAEEDVTVPTTTEAADPREGYFSATESSALNPSLARFQEAWNAYNENNDACNRESRRLFREGASPRRAVQCHLRAHRGLVEGAAGVREALDAVEGEFRPECEAAVDELTAQLGDLEGAWQRVLEGYELYAREGEVAQGLQRQSTTASELSEAFLGPNLVAVTAACYTEEDREQAERDAEQGS